MAGLRELAEQDLGVILEDGVYGFGWSITVIDPNAVSGILTGFSNDIAQVIDPDTGQAVSGRLATAAIRISSLTAAGLGLPVGIEDPNNKPWQVRFNDINGNAYTFKVKDGNPDRALGLVVCVLELYSP